MPKLTITQTRSQIRRPGDQKRTLKALGLGRIGRRVEHEATPQIRGMVEKVRHLVAVEEAA
jgi:large subunit ribosomal protein L30